MHLTWQTLTKPLKGYWVTGNCPWTLWKEKQPFVMDQETFCFTPLPMRSVMALKLTQFICLEGLELEALETSCWRHSNAVACERRPTDTMIKEDTVLLLQDDFSHKRWQKENFLAWERPRAVWLLAGVEGKSTHDKSLQCWTRFELRQLGETVAKKES